jgi:hypothetical protein
VKEIVAIDFNSDTVRIGGDYRETVIEIETDQGNDTYSFDSYEGLIIKKTDGRVVLGVQDEEGN